LNVASLHDAVDWAKRCPLVEQADARLLIRQLYDFGDFGEEGMSDLHDRSEPLAAA
jgi:hypothetical protein